MEDTRPRGALAATLIFIGLVLAYMLMVGPHIDDPAPWAVAPVPTLQPTPAIIVPTQAPAPALAAPPPAVYVESNGGQVVINNSTTNVNIDVCILARCP